MSLASRIIKLLESQEYTSADTSINIIPRVFKAIKFLPDTINLDYGGGKYDTATEYLSILGVTNLVYDPFNRSDSHNKKVLSVVRSNNGADTVTCNNVLNVIKEDDIRDTVIKNCKSLVKSNGTVYFIVYAGNKSGIGKVTPKGYQLNKPTRDYIPEISKYFSDVKIYKDVIICKG